MNLKKGKITNKELVESFGTNNLIDRYQRDNKITGRDKQLLLNKAKKFCNIEDLGRGQYIIHKIYGVEKDDLILPLKKGLYNFLTPLILSKLVEEHYQNNNFKITLPFLGWAKKFDIVNDNYSLIKYNQNKSSEQLGIDKETMFEYFEKMDDCIKYYMQECLTTLSKQSGLDLIDFDSIKMVRKQKLISEPNDNGGIDLIPSEWDEVVSDNDRKFVYDCESKAKAFANIVDNKEKFYGTKSLIYNKELKRLLRERNILFMYSAFNIYCKNIDEIKKTFTKFADVTLDNNNNFITTFNEKFLEYIDKKAKNIHNKEQKKEDNADKKYIKSYRLVETYIDNFNLLSDTTIKVGAENLKDKIKTDDTQSIMEKFNINIIKN